MGNVSPVTIPIDVYVITFRNKQNNPVSPKSHVELIPVTNPRQVVIGKNIAKPVSKKRLYGKCMLLIILYNGVFFI